MSSSQRKFTLVSSPLSPDAQPIAIALYEKGVPFEQITIDLDNKPVWFDVISPLGKTPVLIIDDNVNGREVVLESAVILDYLEETLPYRLHPTDPLQRARHRSWIEFGSSLLADIQAVETTSDLSVFDTRLKALRLKFERLENELDKPRYFAGASFSLVDAVFAPVFRYFDTFEKIADFHVFDGLVKVKAWRKALAERASVRNAVAPDYDDLLYALVQKKNGVLAGLARPAFAA
jgi:glutathione S-transferase